MQYFRRRKDKYGTDPHSRRPPDTRFHQQRTWGWRPILTPVPVIILYLLIGLLFTALGIYFFVLWSQTTETNMVRYDQLCPTWIHKKWPSGPLKGQPHKQCVVPIQLLKLMKKPVYFYYHIENHYQNHRIYVRSRSDYQLQNYQPTATTECAPRVNASGTAKRIGGSSVYLPCGLIPADNFNDTFDITDSSGHTIPVQQQGIAWKSDLQYKFHDPGPNQPGVRVVKNYSDEHFVNHMRVGAFPHYRKLYSIVNQDLQPGTYYVHIHDYWFTNRWNGQKFFLFGTTTWLGGRSVALGLAICYIVVGSLSLLLSLLFFLKHVISPRRLGDDSYIKWDK